MNSVWSRRFFLMSGLALRGQSWESLFNGASTAGWMSVTGGEFPSDCWQIEDCCLKSLVRNPTFQDIRTVKEYGDFELEFVWKIAAGGNGGVKYLIHKYDAWTPMGADRPHARARGLEYQLTDDERSAETKKDATRGTGSLYSKIAPVAPPLRKAGEFNESRIVVKRPALEHWLNGRMVMTSTLPAGVPKRSAIALQNHSSECWFRSIRVREIG